MFYVWIRGADCFSFWGLFDHFWRIERAWSKVIPVDRPNGSFFPFWPNLKDWDARARLVENNIWLGLPVGCQFALLSATEVT